MSFINLVETRRVLANNLLNLREELGMTQEQIADEFLMSTRTYGKLERAETDVKLSTLERVAEVFGITVSNLLSTEFDLKCAAENVMRRFSTEQELDMLSSL